MVARVLAQQAYRAGQAGHCLPARCSGTQHVGQVLRGGGVSLFAGDLECLRPWRVIERERGQRDLVPVQQGAGRGVTEPSIGQAQRLGRGVGVIAGHGDVPICAMHAIVDCQHRDLRMVGEPAHGRAGILAHGCIAARTAGDDQAAAGLARDRECDRPRVAHHHPHLDRDACIRKVAPRHALEVNRRGLRRDVAGIARVLAAVGQAEVRVLRQRHDRD